MYSLAHLRPRFFKGFSVIARKLCSRMFNSDDVENGFGRIEDFLNESWKSSNLEHNVGEKTSNLFDSLGTCGVIRDSKAGNVTEILEILHKDGLDVDSKLVLNSLGIRVSNVLVSEVLFSILKAVNYANKNRCAKLGYKFFVWSGEQEKYKHTTNIYHMMMKIFAECEEYKAMWRLVDEMVENGYPTTARTFNILIRTCGGAGIARKTVERFIKSKSFNYRPFKHSYNAILHSLLTLNYYNLIEWVHGKMLFDGFTPDVFTYNIIMCAKFRLGKFDHFHSLLEEMSRKGLSPDFHTFTLLLHILGKGDNPLAALHILNQMKEDGINPTVLHFTTLIDGLSRAGNLDACHYFFNEMVKIGCVPDVVCYTVMITGYIVAGEFDKAQNMFDEMIKNGQLPNVFTYNSMIRGLCMDGKFEEACSMLKEMESRGCKPNFYVYTTLVGYLRNSGRLSEAHRIIKYMTKKGQYTHLLGKIKRYRR